MRRLLTFVGLVFALPAIPGWAVTIDWVLAGDAYNLADTPATNCYAANCGSVDHVYYISKYETTNAQYAEFLNAKAAADPLGLYNTSMGSDPTSGGITQSGVSGSYTYTVKTGFTDKPVTYVSFYDSLRFSNWLNNGQGSASTETGAYTLRGGTAAPSNGLTVTRNGGANVFLTSENEWYKAAYYDALSATYLDYPTGTDSVTDCVAPGADTGNSANCNLAVNALTDAGAYGLSDSPYGTYDQGGNVWEWTDQIVSGSAREIRGGSWISGASFLAASSPDGDDSPAGEFVDVGFRVASLVPEPGPGLLGMTGVLSVLGLSASRKRRAN